MINIYQGETAYIEIEVFDNLGEAMDLTGASAILAYKQNLTVIKRPCTIESNILAKLPTSETETMLGNYLVEVKLQDANMDVKTIMIERLTVAQSVIPKFE